MKEMKLRMKRKRALSVGKVTGQNHKERKHS